MNRLQSIPLFKKMRFYAITFRIKFGTPLDRESVLDVLSGVKQNSPVIFEPHSRKKDDRWPNALVNKSEDQPEKRINFSADRNLIRLFFGSGVPSDEIERCVRHVFSAVFQVKMVELSTIEWADVVHLFDATYAGSHGKLISRVYHTGSLLDRVFGAKEIVSSDIMLGGIVPDKPHRQCVVAVEGDTSLKEVRSGEFEEKEINVAIGYAQNDAIPRVNAGDFMISLGIDARDYVISNVLKIIIRPLDEALAGERKENA